MTDKEIYDGPWCEGWTSPADCEKCPVVECNCNRVPKEKLDIFNANAFEVETEDGITRAIVESQEHCAIFWLKDGGHAGQYYFLAEGVPAFDFCFWEHARVSKVVRCKVLKYSHDYGQTWCKVNKYE